ncbi:hypothetical protein ACIQU5_31465 [Streptomyces sp. NPDC090306]|uniref:hypothetical protein n=1 Tax=Streptomyces sp. NPDC090306 TaxID=3365961 RepID=UPI0037F90801
MLAESLRIYGIEDPEAAAESIKDALVEDLSERLWLVVMSEELVPLVVRKPVQAHVQRSRGQSALASDAIVEGGRGIMRERQVERFLHMVGTGMEAAREGDPTLPALSEVSRHTVPDVSRLRQCGSALLIAAFTAQQRFSLNF